MLTRRKTIEVWTTGVLFVLVIILASCNTSADNTSDAGNGIGGSSGVTAELFPLAEDCVACHDNIITPAGAVENGVIVDPSHYSFVQDWSNSTHALAALDPAFLAVTRNETLLLPYADEQIQVVCASCHLPMADFTAMAYGLPRGFLDNAALPDSELHALYTDGDSCMICHQLTERPTPGNTSYLNSRLSINLNMPVAGQLPRQLYGYYEVSPEAQELTVNELGYLNTQSDAGRKSIICSVCHTLYTDSFTVDGQPTGSQLPEQVVTLEWLHSSLADRSCQSCHMPMVTDAGLLSNTEIDGAVSGRISRHLFLGADTWLLAACNSDGHLDRGLEETTSFLQAQTARLTLDGEVDSQNQLLLDVRIDSLVGHKFPTGFPARRAWIHVTVTDQDSQVLYESGAYDAQGMILDNAMDQTPGLFEPHYSVIDSPGQVQIYEAVMLDSNGQATTNLLQGICYVKDNRLLPPGFDKRVTTPDIAVIGEALDDPDFIGGSDITHYIISLPNGSGPLVITVELLYQPLSYRFLENLSDRPTTEQQALTEVLEQTPNTPVIVTSNQLVVE